MFGINFTLVNIEKRFGVMSGLLWISLEREKKNLLVPCKDATECHQCQIHGCQLWPFPIWVSANQVNPF